MIKCTETRDDGSYEGNLGSITAAATATIIACITALSTPHHCCTHVDSYHCCCYHCSAWLLYLPHIAVIHMRVPTAAATTATAPMIAVLPIPQSCCTHMGSHAAAAIAVTIALHDCFIYPTLQLLSLLCMSVFLSHICCCTHVGSCCCFLNNKIN